MMTKPKHAWMVRAGDNSELAALVEETAPVAIGWAEMGDVGRLAPCDFQDLVAALLQAMGFRDISSPPDHSPYDGEGCSSSDRSALSVPLTVESQQFLFRARRA